LEYQEKAYGKKERSMVFSKNRQLYIDTEAILTLSLLKEGLFYPVTKLMNEEDANRCDETSVYGDTYVPFSIILSPNGERNHKVLKSVKKGEKLDFICTRTRTMCGHIVVDSTFSIDKQSRVNRIFSTSSKSKNEIKELQSRLGKIVVCGEYNIKAQVVKATIESIKKKIKQLNAKNITAIKIGASPLNRAQEESIRQNVENSDLVIIFLSQNEKQDVVPYGTRKECIEYFINNYLPKNRAIVVPFPSVYVFAGNNGIMLNALMAQNIGCNKMAIKQGEAGLGLFYDEDSTNSIFDSFVGLDLKITIFSEHVYCNICTTIVNAMSCPHGEHHHMHYNTEAILELFKNGLIPPAVLMRKEISAKVLSRLFPNRFQNLQKLHNQLMPSSGMLERVDEENFYIELLDLYQTTSLT
jgi:sulfate adenylyltransferase